MTAGVDSSLRRAAQGFLGGLFQTCLLQTGREQAAEESRRAMTECYRKP